MKKINFNLSQDTTPINLPEELIFGRQFTRHMFVMDYSAAEGGWHSRRIEEYHPLELSPAAMVLHYGQGVFEGLKAYKHSDGRVALFRPDQNFTRMNNSSRRVCIPEIDEKLALESLLELIKIEKGWVPEKEGYSLYIRPFIFANDPFLGVKPGENYTFIIILSPAGPYFPEGFKPISIMATDKYVRAAKKGLGECKTLANYAASLAAQVEAKKNGYTQVLWLDAANQKFIEEVGTMNIFIRIEDEVVTPSLSGTILPGITRLSALKILRDWDLNVSERMISIDEVIDASEKNLDIEIFGTGTAAIVTPVSKLKFRDKEILIGDGEMGVLSKKLYNEIAGIQYGRIKDRYNWLKFVE